MHEEHLVTDVEIEIAPAAVHATMSFIAFAEIPSNLAKPLVSSVMSAPFRRVAVAPLERTPHIDPEGVQSDGAILLREHAVDHCTMLCGGAYVLEPKYVHKERIADVGQYTVSIKPDTQPA